MLEWHQGKEDIDNAIFYRRIIVNIESQGCTPLAFLVWSTCFPFFMKLFISFFIALSLVSVSSLPASASSYKEIQERKAKAAKAAQDVRKSQPKFTKVGHKKPGNIRSIEQDQRDQHTVSKQAMQNCKDQNVSVLDLKKCFKDEQAKLMKELKANRQKGTKVTN